ncbi:hypothetical protein [Pseudonocardia xishanensis]|uniref:Uncharacterized protein n=1 Tax=Pseudonocardia xishanensis TaxID=630995 RepID=A0ABP8RVH9_9PSEU
MQHDLVTAPHVTEFVTADVTRSVTLTSTDGRGSGSTAPWGSAGTAAATASVPMAMIGVPTFAVSPSATSSSDTVPA